MVRAVLMFLPEHFVLLENSRPVRTWAFAPAEERTFRRNVPVGTLLSLMFQRCVPIGTLGLLLDGCGLFKLLVPLCW